MDGLKITKMPKNKRIAIGLPEGSGMPVTPEGGSPSGGSAPSSGGGGVIINSYERGWDYDIMLEKEDPFKDW